MLVISQHQYCFRGCPSLNKNTVTNTSHIACKMSNFVNQLCSADKNVVTWGVSRCCTTGIFFSFICPALITSHSFSPEPEGIWEEYVHLTVTHRCLTSYSCSAFQHEAAACCLLRSAVQYSTRHMQVFHWPAVINTILQLIWSSTLLFTLSLSLFWMLFCPLSLHMLSYRNWKMLSLNRNNVLPLANDCIMEVYEQSVQFYAYLDLNCSWICFFYRCVLRWSVYFNFDCNVCEKILWIIF